MSKTENKNWKKRIIIIVIILLVIAISAFAGYYLYKKNSSEEWADAYYEFLVSTEEGNGDNDSYFTNIDSNMKVGFISSKEYEDPVMYVLGEYQNIKGEQDKQVYFYKVEEEKVEFVTRMGYEFRRN